MVLVAVEHAEECPWCGSPISHAKFREIQERIRDEEKRRLQEAEAKFKVEREAFARKLDEARETIERAKEEKASFDRQLKEAIEKAIATTRKTVEAEVGKALKDKYDADLARARLAFKTDSDKQLVKQAAEARKKEEALIKQLKEMERRLAAKNDNGELVEGDLFEDLKAEFGAIGDRVVRVPKGESADLIHDIKYKDAVCGRILIDTKDRKSWQSTYAAKLRAEMVDQKADYAIIATTAFPKPKRELCEIDGVLVVHPNRVVALIRILRLALVRMFQAKLSTDERADKTAKLYAYINSDACRKKLSESGRIADALLELDVEEHAEHARIWKKRGTMLRRIKAVSTEVADDIAAIVDGFSHG